MTSSARIRSGSSREPVGPEDHPTTAGQEERHMRVRTIQAAAVSLVLAASAPVAHAGGGGAGSPVPGQLFDCYLIANGADAPQTLILDDQFGQRTGARLGKASLLCTPATGTVDSGQLQPGDFSTGDHLTCYQSLSSPGANVRQQLVDPFTTQPSVRVLVPALTCVQSFKCEVGVPCGPGAE